MIGTGPWGTLAHDVARRLRAPQAADAPVWHELLVDLVEQPEFDQTLARAVRSALTRFRLPRMGQREVTDLALLALARRLRSERPQPASAAVAQADLGQWLAQLWQEELARVVRRWRRRDGHPVLHGAAVWLRVLSRHGVLLQRSATTLPEPQRTILLLALAGWTVDEMAAELRLKPGQIRSILRSALGAAREQR